MDDEGETIFGEEEQQQANDDDADTTSSSVSSSSDSSSSSSSDSEEDGDDTDDSEVVKKVEEDGKKKKSNGTKKKKREEEEEGEKVKDKDKDKKKKIKDKEDKGNDKEKVKKEKKKKSGLSKSSDDCVRVDTFDMLGQEVKRVLTRNGQLMWIAKEIMEAIGVPIYRSKIVGDEKINMLVDGRTRLLISSGCVESTIKSIMTASKSKKGSTTPIIEERNKKCSEVLDWISRITSNDSNIVASSSYTNANSGSIVPTSSSSETTTATIATPPPAKRQKNQHKQQNHQPPQTQTQPLKIPSFCNGSIWEHAAVESKINYLDALSKLIASSANHMKTLKEQVY
jgi:hypothetical protein